MWSEPEEPNGVITGYDVVYGVYKEDNSSTVNVKELMLTVDNLSELSHTSQLMCNIPYSRNYL